MCSRYCGFPEYSGAPSAQATRYHASINFPLLVSMRSALQRVENTMKNTIDDVDYIIDQSRLIIIFQ